MAQQEVIVGENENESLFHFVPIRDSLSFPPTWEWFSNWRTRGLTDGMDSGYLDIPRYPWLIRLNLDASSSAYGMLIPNFKYNNKSGTASVYFFSQPYLSASVGGYYRDVGLSIGHSLRNNTDGHFSLSSYGRTIGGNISYERFVTNTCRIEVNSDSTFSGNWRRMPVIENGQTKVSILNVFAYYVLRNKSYAHDAAFSNSVIQQKSAGSVIVALSYNQSTIDMSNSRLAHVMYTKQLSLSSRNIGLGAGYGYNYITTDRRLLLHGSAMLLTFVPVYNTSKITPDYHSEWWTDTEQMEYNQYHKQLETSLDKFSITLYAIIRSSVCYNINEHFVTGLTWNFNVMPPSSIKHFSGFSLQSALEAYVGVRF